MPDKYQALREAAAKATPGPWTYDRGVVPPDGPERYSTISASVDDISIAEVNDLIPEGAANADFMTAASPATIQTLLAERDALRVALRDCVAVMENELNGLAVIRMELKQARIALDQ